jgi:N-methylhydantoinase A
MTGRRLRIAVDVGGTFTDVMLADPADGRLISAKVSTTPNDRADGVLDGIAAALDRAGATGDEVADVVHGSTTGTNALIERTGAKVGFLTTEGFRDVLEIGRVMRPMEGLYDINVDRPPPLVPRRLCLEARERLTATGEVLVDLDEASVAAAAETFGKAGVEAVAICFLFSHLEPRHEERAAEIIARHLPGIPISLSNRISPEYREYERASTTVMNAYLAPIMERYLDDLESRLDRSLGDARLFVVQANGGTASVAAAKARAVTTVNSGPAGGVVAAAWYGRRHKRAHIVSVDMGGTSFDIGLIEDGRSNTTTEGGFQGLPVKIPIIDLHVIGAGGGSIAWIDPGGALNVGPRSAGADPGPACYGRGGEEPTVTDANLVLGRLNPDYFNGGRIALDPDAARRAVERVAGPLGMSLDDAALGIVRVVNANMTKGIAAVTIERGFDVREFSLLSFGGAGGLHAVDLARDLEMAEAVIPPMAGTFSAVGLLVTETRYDYVTALGGITTDRIASSEIEARFAEMEQGALSTLADQGFSGDAVRLARAADLKVAGQTYELMLPIPGTGAFDDGTMAALLRAFGDLYRARYAFFFDGEPIEIVNLRLGAFGLRDVPDLPEVAGAGPDPAPARKGARSAYFGDAGRLETPVYDRELLAPGMIVAGPR